MRLPHLSLDVGLPYRGRRERPRHWRLRGRAVAVPLLVAALATASAPGLVRIHTGDTLWGLAQAHHTTVAAIQRANHLHGDTIFAGQLLRIPGAHAGSVPSVSSGRGWSEHTVQAGDSVWALAARYGTTVGTLVSANDLSGGGLIIIGQRLRVPGAAHASTPQHSPGMHTSSSARSSTTHRVPSTIERHRAELASRPQPSKDTSRAMVIAAARRYGVDPSLALAVAYQESGFQQGVVSSADAIGVMQLLPSTAAWLSADVAGRQLDPFDAQDNITGGVLLLHSLLRVAGTRTAIGAYYQGLGSIRARGMYAETKAYVRAVLVDRRLFR